MSLLIGVHDARVLRAAGASVMTGRFPHLRLVSLVAGPELDAVWPDVPEHIRDRILLDPTPELLASGQVEAMLTDDPAATQAAFPEIDPRDVVTWAQLPGLYDGWLDTHHLPRQHARIFTPDGLFPAAWDAGDLHVEIIGSCGGHLLELAADEAAADFPVDITAALTVKNFPGEYDADASRTPSLRISVPPLRFMHPATLDDFVAHADHERLLVETIEHMGAYLGEIAAVHPGVPLFVCGFLEPHMNPMGAFFPARHPSNFKHFVRCLNDALVAWCEQHAHTHFVDADAIAGAIGKQGIDDGAHMYFAHRSALDAEYDDNHDAGTPLIPVARSYDVRTREYAAAVVREVLHRHATLTQAGRVKPVIFDLDNTLWRGLASDGEIGTWNGRPQGIVEAIKVLKRRGVFVAIASKNDEAYIREHWDDILSGWPEIPLTCSLSLDDFDAIRINFKPKSLNVAELLAELNIGADAAVFIDDNPLEREEVQAAFPQLRVLGAEINHVRRELLYSPFTQAELHTDEDQVRARTAKRQVELQQHQHAGTAEGFLAALGLRCTVEELAEPESPRARRAVQLINKTNQWSLNGGRVGAADAARAVAAGQRLVVAEVRDAHTSYGIVAAALVDPARAAVSHLVVSCRVIGMGIDDAFTHTLLDQHGPLALDYQDSGRNRAAAAAIARWTGDATPSTAPVVDAVPAPEHVRVEAASPSPITA